MDKVAVSSQDSCILVPITALSLYAVASGYLMSLIPLALTSHGLDNSLASWLASAFFAGLLVGAFIIEPLIGRLGHQRAFIWSLITLLITVVALPALPYSATWVASRLVAGISVAGVFVVVESWLLHGDVNMRAKRLGIYMSSLYGGTSIGQFSINLLGVRGWSPFIVISVVLILAVLVLLLPNTKQPEKHQSTAFSIKKVKSLNQPALIGCLVSGLTLGAVYGLMPLALTSIGISHDHVGSLMALVIIGGMAIQPLIPYLSKFLGHKLLMAALSLFGGAAAVVTIFSHDHMMLGMSLFILGMAIFALYPVAINLGSSKLPAEHIVSATQIMLLVYSIGSVVGPIMVAAMDKKGQGLFSFLLAALMITCLYMLLMSVGRRQLVAGD